MILIERFCDRNITNFENSQSHLYFVVGMGHAFLIRYFWFFGCALVWFFVLQMRTMHP